VSHIEGGDQESTAYLGAYGWHPPHILEANSLFSFVYGHGRAVKYSKQRSSMQNTPG
jgi:hypothetical protein